MSKDYPIPKEARCVFKGVIFDVYQWEQEMFDGSFQTFEKLKRADTIQVIPILENGNILILKEKQPNTSVFTTFAGGRREKNEKPEETARRELLEETGLEAKEIILWKKFKPLSKIEWDVYYFFARGLTKKQEPDLDGGEKIEIEEISFEKFLKLTEDPTFRAGDLEKSLIIANYNQDKAEEIKKLFYNQN